MLGQPSALERLLRPLEGDLPADFARRLLAIDFSPSDRIRYRALSTKSVLETLTSEERLELDDLLTANDVLAILHTKAQFSLKQTPTA
jgi:hypothetical protein